MTTFSKRLRRHVVLEQLFICVGAAHLSSGSRSLPAAVHIQPGHNYSQPEETAPCGPLMLLDGRSGLIGQRPICHTIWAFDHES